MTQEWHRSVSGAAQELLRSGTKWHRGASGVLQGWPWSCPGVVQEEEHRSGPGAALTPSWAAPGPLLGHTPVPFLVTPEPFLSHS